MRKILLTLAVFLLLASPAFAATTDEVDVTVTVPTLLALTWVSGDLAFADITTPFTDGPSATKTLNYTVDCNLASGWKVQASMDYADHGTWDTAIDLEVKNEAAAWYALVDVTAYTIEDDAAMANDVAKAWLFRLNWTADLEPSTNDGLLTLTLSAL